MEVPEQSRQHPAPRPGALRAWGYDLLLALAAFLIFLLIYQPVRVEGTSMLPVLEDEDRLLVSRIWGGQVHRGDVVVFLYPRDHTKRYIKRVIAMPGDTIRIDQGTVYVNGKRVSEPYVPARFTDERSQPQLSMGKDEFFLMGDHRVISSDSRNFGPVDRSLIYGKAAFVYWPMEQAGVVH